MSTQAVRQAERGYHQDYIARIRYENTLPPPPGAPKLLNIPTEGLNYYTSAAFGSRLARQQPLNIEADAELGMPIDLVGMPGIFDGDESSIQAPLAVPPTHSRDKNFLRPVSELGKPKFSAGGHSFLRRTEYISSEAKARAEANASAAKATTKSPTQRLRRPVDVSKEDPLNIMRHIVKGFDIVNPEEAFTGRDGPTSLRGAVPMAAELEAWRRPKHPTKSNVKLVDSYAIKPDLEAFPDSGTYYLVNIAGNPTNTARSHDKRVDVGLIFPEEKSDGKTDFHFYLPNNAGETTSIKRQFDGNDPDRDDESLRTRASKSGAACTRYDFHRTYDSYREQHSTHQPYKEVALALHDPVLDRKTGNYQGDDDREKAAYYYPIGSKIQLKPRRNKALVQLGLASQHHEDSTEKFDAYDVVIREADEDEIEKRGLHRADYEPNDAVDGATE